MSDTTEILKKIEQIENECLNINIIVNTMGSYIDMQLEDIEGNLKKFLDCHTDMSKNIKKTVTTMSKCINNINIKLEKGVN